MYPAGVARYPEQQPPPERLRPEDTTAAVKALILQPAGVTTAPVHRDTAGTAQSVLYLVQT